ncbi:unnamed protein product, partial [Choristocarpus tenellus]
MNALVESNVWTQLQRSEDWKVVGTKITFKRKVDPDGGVKQHNSRFVVQGFRQVEGFDFTEKYSPTLATASTRMQLAMAAMK